MTFSQITIQPNGNKLNQNNIQENITSGKMNSREGPQHSLEQHSTENIQQTDIW